MKKLIPLFILALCLTGCAGKIQVENPDTLSAAVLSLGDSVTAKQRQVTVSNGSAAKTQNISSNVDMYYAVTPTADAAQRIFLGTESSGTIRFFL